jgi:hypothetical protein
MAGARAVPLAEAYSRALELEGRARLHEPEEAAIGYRLYCVTTYHTGVSLLTGHGDHRVIGRHTQCDVRLPEEDPVISLRHVLVRTWVLDDGLPLVGVLDLDSGVGFELADGTRQRSVVASGPIAFRVGTTWLLGLPRRGELPPTLHTPVVQRSDASPYRVNPHAGIPRSSHRGVSRITVVPASVRLTGGFSPHAVPQFGAPLQPTDAYEIILQQDGRTACVRVSERDVEHGILIGRDPKCIDAGLRALLNTGISRVHALVIRERDGVHVYDIASMNGMMLPGTAKVRSAKLEPAGTTVFLRGYGTMVMTWRGVTPAP